MKRECEFRFRSPDGKRAVYIDKINKNEIEKYLNLDNRHKNKFRFFLNLFLGGHRNEDIYKKEAINDKCKDVTAIRFFVGQENDRIYCKEIKSGSNIIVIVMSILHLRKKSEGLSSREINSIETVAKFDYEIK